MNELRVSFNEKRLDVQKNRLRSNYSESASKTPDNRQSKFNNRNRLNRVDGTRENPCGAVKQKKHQYNNPNQNSTILKKVMVIGGSMAKYKVG